MKWNQWIGVGLIASMALFTSCKKNEEAAVVATASNTKAISTFSFLAAGNSALSADITGTVADAAITANAPAGTDVTALIATFTTDGNKITIGISEQVSGTTANDFTSAVSYTVTAADGTTSDYAVTLTVDAATTTTTTTPAVVTPTLMGGTMQGVELSLSKVVSTFAGTTGTSGSADGVGTAASFNYPDRVTTDGTNLYLADSNNALIRKIVISTGAVTTLAGSGTAGFTNGTGVLATFSGPSGITTDGTNLFVTEFYNHSIRKIVISSGEVTTLAGTGSAGTVDGTGVAASFSYPTGITTDGTNLFVSGNTSNLIRKVVISTGVVTTFAGTGSVGSTDGTGTAASFKYPEGITTDGTSLYVTDSGNHLIRKIVISTGVVTTLAGTGTAGSVDGIGTAASFNTPRGISTDGINLYIGGYLSNLVRQIVISTGVVTTLAGTGVSGSANGTGTAASFNIPVGVTTDGTNLYVVDKQNFVIRKIE